ncbi:Uncharacterized protein OBRU01_12073, partial [Operophtera brumata]
YFWHITDLHYDPFHNSPEFHKGEGWLVGKQENGSRCEGWLVGKQENGSPCEGWLVGKQENGAPCEGWLVGKQEYGSRCEGWLVGKQEYGSRCEGWLVGKQENGSRCEGWLVGKQEYGSPCEGWLVDKHENGSPCEGWLVGKQENGAPCEGWLVGKQEMGRHARAGWLSHFSLKVYLVAHAGPGVEERQNAGSASAAGGGELTPSANARLLHVIRAFSDVIAGQFYGHRHADTFRLIYSEGRPVSWALLAPSLTPRGAGSISNPGLRLYKFDSNTGKVLDYTQYYLDVTSTRGELHWAIEYNLTQYYGLREVSATSLDALAERMRSHYDRGAFNKYLSALRVRHNPETSECDTACVHVHYCAITRADYHEFRACVRNPASALASRAPSHSAAILVYAILILLTS